MSDAADSIGTMATGGLIAHEIERARRGAPAVGRDEHEACANCGTERVGPFCHACGQTGHLHRNVGALVHDIAHGVFHFEGKIWNTLPLLAWRPGELTRRYVHGERVKFVSPMALFLFSVFLMFAVMSNFGHGAKSHDEPKRGNAELTRTGSERQALETKLVTYRSLRASLPGEEARAKMDAKVTQTEADLKALAVPAKIEALQRSDGNQKERAELKEKGFDTGLGWFDYLVSHAAKNPELATYKLKTYGYKYSWALIPISVPFIWLLFCLRRGVGFYDHAIFAIYSLAFMSLAVVALFALAWVGVPMALIWLAVFVIPPLHMYRQLKGAYELGRWGAMWRTFALLVITSITSSLYLAFLVWMGSD